MSDGSDGGIDREFLTDKNINLIGLFAALGMGFGAFANSQGITLFFVLLFSGAMVAHMRFVATDGGSSDE